VRLTRPLVVSALGYGVSWFLPAFHDESTLYGWEAFRLVIDLLLARDLPLESLPVRALFGASALTNAVYLGALPAIVTGARPRARVAFWALIVAAVVNAQWMVTLGRGLRLGYYLWWGSFVILAWAAHQARRGSMPANDTQTPTAS
jgi:hypothetical protein